MLKARKTTKSRDSESTAVTGSGKSSAVTHDLLPADPADRVFRFADGRRQATSGSGSARSADRVDETTGAP